MIYFKTIHNKQLNYICRLRDNSLLISKNKDDHIEKLRNGVSTRVIKYTINNNNYHMVTNLFNNNEYTIKTIKIYTTIDGQLKNILNILNHQ